MFASESGSEFFDDLSEVVASPGRMGRVRKSGSGKFATSLPSGGFDLMQGEGRNDGVAMASSSLTAVPGANLPVGVAGMLRNDF